MGLLREQQPYFAVVFRVGMPDSVALEAALC